MKDKTAMQKGRSVLAPLIKVLNRFIVVISAIEVNEIFYSAQNFYGMKAGEQLLGILIQIETDFNEDICVKLRGCGNRYVSAKVGPVTFPAFTSLPLLL